MATKLDIASQVLAETGDKRKEYWVGVIVLGLAAKGVQLEDTKLLDELTDSEAVSLLEQLRAERRGILNWLIGGAKTASQMPPNKRHRLRVFAIGAQN